MNTFKFLSHLRNLNIKLFTDGERLRISAPKRVLTPALCADLAERKAELLMFLHQANLAVNSMLPPITPVSRNENLPLSFAQQRLWFLDQLEPGGHHYHIPRAMKLSGHLNTQALQHALDTIVTRHGALRTTFISEGGIPKQVISEHPSLDLPVIDLSECPQIDQDAEVQRSLQAEMQKPFNLSSDLMLRATLLKLDEEEHLLNLVIHHIAADGWSMGVFFRELSKLYKSYSSGKPSPLPELSIQYADFAVWQREWLQGEALEKQLSYWRQQLSVVPALELPSDRPRPPVQTFRGALHPVTLSKPLAESLNGLSREEGTTLFMTLLAGFQTLLHRYTGQTDIVVGSPIANRNRAEIEGMIGFFVNTLVLRGDLSNNPAFREMLNRVREVCLQAYAHQDLPFERLVEELQLERDLARHPLFQVMFILQNAPTKHPLELSGLRVTPLTLDGGTAKFDLTLSLVETGEGLKGTLEYNTDLFDPATIQRMVGHFESLLEGIVADPDQRLSDLPLLTQAERHQLLTQWNDTKADYPADQCMHQLFEAQVERTPDATAVVFEDEHLTYRELNRCANQLAHYLQKLGVGSEVLVGICVERSLEMVIGLLGILKAGAAYVPLDPAYPKVRLAYMLSDADTHVLLTQSGLLEGLPEHDANVLCLDSGWGDIAQESEVNPNSGVGIENLAYVMYTSGSTGKPKGVSLHHRALSNLIVWQLRNSTLSTGARTLQFTSLSFDVSFQEMFATWCSGGTLVLVPEILRQDIEDLTRFIMDNAIERLFLPFVALKHLAEAMYTQDPASIKLREIITAGEQLQVTQHMVRLFDQLEDCTLHNQYGPSETHVVTAFPLTEQPCDWAALPPIGRPIANTQIYLLDQYFNPVPVGVPGELYIGGVNLARSYLNQAELTAEKFIPNPYSDEPGARLYKTGDLARYLPDGNIEFLGRSDHQVKIRGFRVEPGEIEAVLRQNPTVQEAVVIVREVQPGNKRLLAYIIPNKSSNNNVVELRDFLKQELPGYMVPSTYVLLDALPLTPTGKIDRQNLPVSDKIRSGLDEGFEAPRTAIELLISDIWKELLEVDKISVYDNFFDLGGHSFLVIQVIAKLDKHIGVRLNPKDFMLQTLGQVAAVCEEKMNHTTNNDHKKRSSTLWDVIKKGFFKKSN